MVLLVITFFVLKKALLNFLLIVADPERCIKTLRNITANPLSTDEFVASFAYWVMFADNIEDALRIEDALGSLNWLNLSFLA